MALTAFGVSRGFACSINATIPATTGADWLVPLRLRYGTYPGSVEPAIRAFGRVRYRWLSGLLNETVPTPGATTSGLAMRSIAVGPRELKSAIVSSARAMVPMWLAAPTVSTHGALPGAVIAPY